MKWRKHNAAKMSRKLRDWWANAMAKENAVRWTRCGDTLLLRCEDEDTGYVEIMDCKIRRIAPLGAKDGE